VAFAFVLLAAWTTWWHRHYGMIDFGGLDGGLLVQAAWGVSTGNIPYHDIPDPLPPLFFLGAGWAFRLLGPSWSSLNWLVTAYAFVTLTWSFLLLGRITRRPWYALAVAFALQAITLMPLSWWWYNQITTLAGVLALLSGYGLSRAPGDRGLAVSLGASVALLLLTKLNTAVFLSAAIALFLLARRETRKTTLACFACAGLADLLLLTLQHVPVLDYLHLVSQFSSRVSSLDWIRFCLIGAQPVEHWTGLIMFAFFTLGGVALSLLDRDKVRRQGAIIWILIAAGATSIQMVTNNDFKLGDIALVVAPVAVGVGLLERFLLVRLAMLLSVAFPVLLGLMIGQARSRIVSIGPRFYAGSGAPDRVLKSPPFFRGLSTEYFFDQVLQEVGTVLASARGSGTAAGKIFFGPRLDFCYAAYDLPYPTGLPIWWEKVPSSHWGENAPTGIPMPSFWSAPSHWLPENGPYDPRVQRFIADKFQLCIFVRGYESIADMSFFPPNLRGYIYQHYRKIDYPDIVVFQAR
jgi:hypothetical protein